MNSPGKSFTWNADTMECTASIMFACCTHGELIEQVLPGHIRVRWVHLSIAVPHVLAVESILNLLQLQMRQFPDFDCSALPSLCQLGRQRQCTHTSD
jgi:hypothetical protein